MKRAKALTVLLMIALFTFSCSDGGGKKTTDFGPGPGDGGTLAEHEGDNSAVTEDNVSQVIMEINGIAWDVFGRAMNTSFVGKPAIVEGDVNGYDSGKATVEGKITTIMDSSFNPTGTNYNFTCTYYDFSDDGELWLGDSMTYIGSMDTNSMAYNITVYGNISFAGKYRGSEEFVTTISTSQTGISYSTTYTMTSGGKTFSDTIS